MEQDYLYDIQLTSDGGFVAGGFTYGSTENIWVVKTDSLGCDTTECNYLGVEELKRSDQGIMVFPNPSSGKLVFQINNGQWTMDNDKIEIYNIYGQEIAPFCLPPFGGSTTFSYNINMSSFPNGIYLYRVLQEDGSLVGSGKVIIVK